MTDELGTELAFPFCSRATVFIMKRGSAITLPCAAALMLLSRCIDLLPDREADGPLRSREVSAAPTS